MLHITNGGSAAELIRAAALPGSVLAWNDVLHDGPVPADISFNQLRAVRARFISDSGWRPFEEVLREFTERDRALESSLREAEVVLWFEHDLYDQLQLIQLLDWFATCELGATSLTLICGAEYLGQSTPTRLAARFPERRRVGDAEFDVARRAWAAFRSPDPTMLEPLAASQNGDLPYLGAALLRHLEQFPSVSNGLSRTESQALDVLAAGPASLGSVYRASHHDREAAVFLGDQSFAAHLHPLSRAPHPLLAPLGGGPLPSQPGPVFWGTQVEITPFGRDVLDGKADHVRANGIDRWLGGVHLQGDQAVWRWDTGTRRLRHPS
jgi:hypothetical protein